MAEWTPAQRAVLQRMLEHASSRTRREIVEEDITDERTLTDDERDRRLQAVVRAGHEIVKTLPDRARIVALEEPPASDLPRIWKRLVARFRGAPDDGRFAGP